MSCRKEINYWTMELIRIIQKDLTTFLFQVNLNLLPSLPPGWNLVKLQNNKYVYTNNTFVFLPFLGNCIALWGITNSIYTGNGIGKGEPVADKKLSELFLNYVKYSYELRNLENPPREKLIKVISIRLAINRCIKDLLCTNSLTNNSSPQVQNYNLKYPWINISPNWDYQQKVQYNASGQLYLANMKTIAKVQEFSRNTCAKGKVAKKSQPYPIKYVKSLEEVLLQRKAIELSRNIGNIFL